MKFLNLKRVRHREASEAISQLGIASRYKNMDHNDGKSKIFRN